MSTEEEDIKDLHDHNFWFSVHDKSTTEVLYGYNAILRLFSVSPVLKLFLPIFKLSIFARVYNFVATKFGEETIRGADYVGPNKPFEDYQRKSFRMTREFVAVLFFIYILWWNVDSLYDEDLPRSIRWIGPTIKIDQWWGMFAPKPPRTDGWFVMPGLLADGTEVDIFRGGIPVTYDKPDLVSDAYPTQRWRKYMMNLSKSANVERRLHYGRYLCREWNNWDRHPPEKRVVSFKIVFVAEKTPPPGHPFGEVTLNL